MAGDFRAQLGARCAQHIPTLLQNERKLPRFMVLDPRERTSHAIVVAWMAEVSALPDVCLSPATFHLAVKMMVRYWSLRAIQANLLQLTACAAIMLAAKIEEDINYYDAASMSNVCGRVFSPERIVRVEADMCAAFDYNLHVFATPHEWHIAVARELAEQPGFDAVCTAEAFDARADMILAAVLDTNSLMLYSSQIVSAAFVIHADSVGVNLRPFLNALTGIDCEMACQYVRMLRPVDAPRPGSLLRQHDTNAMFDAAFFAEENPSASSPPKRARHEVDVKA